MSARGNGATVPHHFPRLAGYDVARSLAMLGMMVVHFSLVGAADRAGPGWLVTVLGLLDGRASATFVILAGVGVTLMTRRAVASGDSAQLASARRALGVRGVVLLALGFVNLTIWSGDILRVYGVSLFVAAALLGASNRALLVWAGGFAAAFALAVCAGDFERNWDFATLTYRNLWTPAGVLRNLFYDGFRSVLPWTGFVLYGMGLGRLDLADPRVGRRVLAVGVAVAAAAETASRLLVGWLSADPPAGLDAEEVRALFGTESMPALPLFLLAAGGTATAVIAACVRLTAALPGRGWAPLAATGRMALTWYFAHIVFGLGTLESVGAVGTMPLTAAAGWGVAFFALAVMVSWAWQSLGLRGPLEWAVRRLAG